MARIVLDLPDELIARLRADAGRVHTTVEALLARYVAANPPVSPQPPLQAASFWGVGVGRPGTHGSIEAIDAYVRELRDEWDER